ncbi:hypothetical protein GGR57DRAFT_470256 [Xylariaceae sp. FL1272]|nr:hypothetical protein GGR57DRAFT_470256 [Xylariaceae sp. FL1272]
MPLELLDVDAGKDFAELTERMIEAFQDPPQSYLEVYFGLPGKDEQAQRRRIDRAAARFALMNEHSPNNLWQKVVDTDTGSIVGGASWSTYSEDPFIVQSPIKAPWLPDDGSRKFAESFIRLVIAPRAKIGRRPQLVLNLIFTTPTYRRRGIGQRLMSWGVDRANQLGLEMFIDASPLGKLLYEANGFTTVVVNKIVPDAESKDEAWREMEERVGLVTIYLMWRPAGEPYMEGKTVFPWECT